MPSRRCRNGELDEMFDRWSEFMEVSELEKSHPTSAFLFLAVDSLSPRRYATLRSDLIPCTQTTTTLSVKYWLKAGTQVEVCSVDIDGVALSCAYLSEEGLTWTD
ncbi:hypothetical protein KIN20_037000 [Parelaphostrongylus tenuis]|uniref:Uncharacterized protein n=1 Tax=Parelaphostrongylus tenuis TaxID=148309 RepID=A0AAD5RDN1_PARTN|nr:hypothetical protein KIN20_037000 [Parelaphostrongylus tenuis]